MVIEEAKMPMNNGLKSNQEPKIKIDDLKIEDLKKSLDNIQENSDIDTPRLLTAALGLGSETGEFVEIVKKMILLLL